MMRIPRGVLLAACLSGTVLLRVPRAHAQTSSTETPQPPQAAPKAAAAPKQTSAVEEVIVTAQKRRERSLDVPAAVNTLSGQDLVNTQASHLTDYLSRIPGASFSSQQEGYTQPVIRGIATGANSSTTGIYIDETPYGSSTGYASAGVLTPDIDPEDLTRIEVLSGPQGTLYGANSLGGLIKYVTAPPDLTRVLARSSAEFSDVDGGGLGYGLREMFNVPIVRDQLALRVSAYKREDPGYVDNPVRDEKNNDATFVEGVRTSVLWQPNVDLTVNGLFLINDIRSNNEPVEDVRFNLAPIYGPRVERRFANELEREQNKVASLSIGYDLGWVNIKGTSSYTTLTSENRSDQNNSSTPGLLSAAFGHPGLGAYFGVNTNTERVTDEVRFSSPTGGRVEWQGGFYYDHQRNNQLQNLQVIDELSGAPFSTPVVERNVLLAQYTEFAGYADVRINITPQFDVLLGGRYSANNQTFTLEGSGLIQARSLLTRLSSDESKTWLVNPRYKITDNAIAYVRIASGYAPGGPNPVVPGAPDAVPTSFGPETIVNYEAGVKASLLDRRVTVTLDGFYINWRAIQLGTTVFVNGSSYFVDENGGKAASRGGELAASYNPLPGLSLTAAGAFVNASLIKDAPGVGGLSGDRLARVPQVNAAVGATYRWEVRPGVDAFVGANWRYNGNEFTDYSNASSRVLLPSYNVLDIRAGLNYGPVECVFFIKNLNDANGITNLSIIDPRGAGYAAASLIQPRTFGLTLTAKY